MAALGPLIKDLRERAGLTQEQLGAALGVSGSAVTRWESPAYGHAPSPKTLAALLTAVAASPASRARAWTLYGVPAADLAHHAASDPEPAAEVA